LALLTVVSVVGAACSNNNTPTNTNTSAGPQVHRGGTYRTAIEDFGWTGAFDPTGEYLTTGFLMFGEMLMRPLMTYAHVKGLAGDKLYPDLAAATPEISSDGMTYTFKLKTGVKFAPPVNRAVTSHDIEYAFERINTKPLVAQYGFYYFGVIQGMDGSAKSPAPISGIETPDDQTIIFHLTAPTGDFLYRLAMPATGPMPKEVASCFTKAGDYGRDVISSGPYMIRGSDKIDVSSCSAIKPMEGFDPTKKLILVRNPNYDPATDSKTIRENNIDGVSVTIDTNTDDIFNKVETGDLDGSLASVPTKEILSKYLTDPALKGLYHYDSADATSYETMNLLVPPFDDVHVRKAVNWVIDKAAIQKAAGGPTSGAIAAHIFPPSMLDEGNYDPYATPNNGGDVNKAKDEMKQSKYDHNQDGVCDDPVCKNVLMISRSIPPRVDYIPILQQDLGEIGIQLKVRELDTGTAYQTIQTVKNLVAFSNVAGWAKDYADPSTFAVLFHSSGINCEGQIDYSEVGMTSDQAKECGVTDAFNKVGGNTMSVDSDIDACNKLQAGQDRTNCWVALDKKLMEEVVPWVPYLWPTSPTVLGKSVTKYEYDQNATEIALVHIAVNNTVDPNTLA
jgi:peptide/nickel transport system substrate-binding protein